MGQSTDGIICFGIKFDEGDEFPWDADEFAGDIDDWWRTEAGWKDAKPLYDDRGERLPGVTEADISAHYAARRAFDDANPLQVELVNYCSGDCPMYILAVQASIIRCNRGHPMELSASLAIAVPGVDVVQTFCEKYGIEMPAPPQWYLASYWG